MNELKAARCRNAARWLIFGSFVIGLLACVIRLVLVMNDVINFDRYVLPNGTRLALPLDMLILIAVVVALMVIGVILLIRSVGYAKRAAEEEKELLAREDEEADSAYIEKDLAEPTATARSEKVEPLEEAARSVMRAEDVDEKKAERVCRRTASRSRKGASVAAKTALVAIPVVLAVAATAVVMKSMENNRRAKNRHRFYDWLG